MISKVGSLTLGLLQCLTYKKIASQQHFLARTSLGPWKFVSDMGSSSHRGLIMIPGQEANLGDNLGIFFFNLLDNND